MLIKPAQILQSSISNNISVSDLLLKKSQEKATQMNIVNNNVYLISRGCLYEHLLSDFSPKHLDNQFTKNNKALNNYMKKSNDRRELQNVMDELTQKHRKGLLKNLIYSKKFSFH